MAALLDGCRRLVAFCIVFISLWHICLASPLQVERPGWSNNFNNLQFLKRSTSKDASCPAGWLCEQQGCPADVICPTGEVCVDFEGTPACAPSGNSWCALNPSTLQAVECRNGICCHGNCYAADAVCCDNTAVQCTIGKLCNACGPGQTCTTGASTCAGGGGSPTTSKSTTATSPSISLPSTSKISVSKTSMTSAKISSSTTKTSPSSTKPSSITTTTSTAAPSPTEVSQVGNFVDRGCFQDSPDSGILVGDSTEDQSSTGMTVEKCVAFALQNNWQYAGVEFGGQCFVGNSLHGASTAPQSDCSQACAGNPLELCGNGNRLQLYQDTTWFSPTTQQLIDELTQYNATLASAQSAIQNFHSDMQQYQNDLGTSSSSKKKRQGGGGGVLTATLRLDLENIHGDFSLLKVIQASILREEDIIRRLFQLAMYLDLPKPVQGIPVTSKIFQDLVVNVIEATTTSVDEVTQTAETADAAIGPALEQSVIPAAIDAAADVAVASSALTSVGLWVGVGAGTGIFAAIQALLDELTGPPGGNPTTTPGSKPTSTSSTTSSTTCTMTATPTPIIIVTTTDTTTMQFDNLVASLPQTSKPMTFTSNTEGHWWLIATLDQCTSEALWDNPNVEAMCIDNYIVGPDTLDPLTVLPTNPDELPTKKSRSPRHASHTHDELNIYSNFSSLGIKSRQLSDNSHIVTQTNAADNLNWISGLSRQSNIHGPYYDFEKYTYDDGANLSVLSPTWVYYIDGSGFAIHSDYASRIGLHTAAWAGYADSGPAGLDPDSSHGTSMASCAAGSFAGPAKDSQLGLVRLKSNSRGYSPISATMVAFGAIISHSANVNSRGRSVVGMSFGAPVALLWWPRPTRNPSHNGLEDGTDVFGLMLQDLYKIGIAAVQSAGNGAALASPLNDLGFQTPRRNGGANTPLIVVGNNGLDNTRYTSSQTVDSAGRNILSMYAVGVDCVCGEWDSTAANTVAGQNKFRRLANQAANGGISDENGTSQAAAQTAGIIADMLKDPAVRAQLMVGGLPNFAMAVKTRLIQMAAANKGGFADNIPRLSNGVSVPCIGPGTPGLPTPPAANIPALQQIGLTPTVQEVASGTTVTIQTPPQCFNL